MLTSRHRLAVVGCASLVAVGACYLSSTPVVDVLFGLPLALVAPGVAVVEASRLGWRFQPGERAVWSVVMSVALDIAGGLLLNLLGGLTRAHWLLYLSCVVLMACGWGMWRVPEELRLDNHSREQAQQARADKGSGCLPGRMNLLWTVSLYVASVAVIAGALVVAEVTSASTREKFAELSLNPVSAAPRVARLEIDNFMGRDTTFEVRVYRVRSEKVVELHSWKVRVGSNKSWTTMVDRPTVGSLEAILRNQNDTKHPSLYVTLGPGGT